MDKNNYLCRFSRNIVYKYVAIQYIGEPLSSKTPKEKVEKYYFTIMKVVEELMRIQIENPIYVSTPDISEEYKNDILAEYFYKALLSLDLLENKKYVLI